MKWYLFFRMRRLKGPTFQQTDMFAVYKRDARVLFCPHLKRLIRNLISLAKNTMPKKGLLERLAEGPVIGDGGFIFCLEKRGYVKAGPWTPEVLMENPEVVEGLHREFLRAGSDVMQAFTYYASDDKLDNRGNKAGQLYSG